MSTYSIQDTKNLKFSRKNTAFLATAASAQTIAHDTVTDVVFDAHPALSGTGNKTWVVPISGLYNVNFSGEFAANATGYRQAFIDVNGANVHRFQVVGSATAGHTLTLHAQLQLEADDEVKIRVYQNSTGNLNIIANGTPGGTDKFGVKFAVAPVLLNSQITNL